MARASARSASNSGSASAALARLSMKLWRTWLRARCSCGSSSAWRAFCLKFSAVISIPADLPVAIRRSGAMQDELAVLAARRKIVAAALLILRQHAGRIVHQPHGVAARPEDLELFAARLT